MFSEAICITCSPLTLATFLSSGTASINASTPIFAAVYPTRRRRGRTGAGNRAAGGEDHNIGQPFRVRCSGQSDEKEQSEKTVGRMRHETPRK